MGDIRRTSQATAAGNEFANPSFAETDKTNQQTKDTVMKMKNTVLNTIIAVTQSKWLRPALMTLAIFVAVLGVTGCKPHH